jgi:hypothetical protein
MHRFLDQQLGRQVQLEPGPVLEPVLRPVVKPEQLAQQVQQVRLELLEPPELLEQQV